MPDLIMLRLKPSKPMAPGGFTALLTGLTISAFDLTFADSVGGVLLGNATGVANPHLTSTTNNNVTIGNTPILQHYVDITDVVTGTHRHLESVATAVIVVSPPAGHAEYPSATSYDLRLELANASGQSIADHRLDFNVAVTTVGSLSTSQKVYFAMPTGAFVTLPATGAALDPNVAFVDLPPDGQAPAFDLLVHAINLVLADDPGAPTPDLVAIGQLTPAQSRYVAKEIIWNRAINPPPAPDPSLGVDPFGALYTDPQVDPSVDADNITKARPRFEAEQDGYYGTLEAEAVRLAGFVFSASAAVAEEVLSIQATHARLEVPLITGAATPTTQQTAGVALVESGGLTPPFVVPAAYFYALASSLPSQVGAKQRFDMARLTSEAKLLDDVTVAVDGGVIAVPAAPLTTAAGPVGVVQVARRLHALGQVETSLVEIPLVAPVDTLVGDWLAHPGPAASIVADFWVPEVAAHPVSYLELLLEAVTQNFAPLVAAIKGAPNNVATVAGLIAMTDQQWRDLFLGPPPPAGAPPRIALLPPWTLPGTPPERVEAFIRHLRTFFAVTAVPASGPAAAIGRPPVLPLSVADVFAAFVAGYPAHSGGSAFSFATPPDADAVAATVADIFPGDFDAQAWLARAVAVIGAVWTVTDVGAGELHFSLMEALYARGFTSSVQIAALTLADFQYALSAGVAFGWAAAIYAKAGGTGGPSASAGEQFNPVNPTGDLADCVPPPYLSPLGPVEYLRQLLDVSAASTCDGPLRPGDESRIGALLAARRGSLGGLHATAANLETPVPTIDLVNESLESMVTTLPGSAAGAVYDSAADEVAGHLLAAAGEDPGGEPWHHDPQMLFAALPEHSTPSTPVGKPAAYDVLRQDFSSPALPYAQALDVNRSYLEALRTSRFATMRHFRRDITEFAIDAVDEPADFQCQQWRYPVRLPIALEYLGISPEEYDQLYAHDLVDVAAAGQQLLRELYGFAADTADGQDWTDAVRHVPEFLRRTGLTYCEFIDLWRSGSVPFNPVRFPRDESGEPLGFPDCEPCCPDDLIIDFGDADVHAALRHLIVFIRLWRTLRTVQCTELSFDELRDATEVLVLFGPADGAVNPQFVRQLAALLMLRELFSLPLRDEKAAPVQGATGADNTHLLALWVGPAAAHWAWAVNTLVEQVDLTADCRKPALTRQPELDKVIADNLDPLSRLAGFDPGTLSDTWHAQPTGTLRFAEVLLKIYLSGFTLGEVLFLFSDEHLDGDDPFPLPTPHEAADNPLELPGDDQFSLWALRRRLLDVEVDDDAVAQWTWARITASLVEEFGYVAAPAGDPLTTLGEHFFPSVLEREGWPVPMQRRRFSTSLPIAQTTPQMWNTPPDGPFRYDVTDETLSAALPLRDGAIAEKLSMIRALSGEEQAAVQALYFAPRTVLARFGLLFANLVAATETLLDARDDEGRFAIFAAAFACFHRRCEVIAEHLAEHVAHAASQRDGHIGAAEVWRCLRELDGDENAGLTSWEDDSGAPLTLTWPDALTGGAFAALLALLGTGVTGVYRTATADPAWRETRGPLSAFGGAPNRWNAPVPTVVPSMGLILTADQLRLAAIRNGFALRDADGEALFGAQPFGVDWSGTLLVEEPGRYEFAAGSLTAEEEEPGREDCPGHRWLVTLRRGQKTWQLLNRDWAAEPGPDFRSGPLDLRRGAYQLTVRLVHDQPDLAAEEDIEPRHTGFQLKYAGPDTDDRLLTVPHHRLYLEEVAAPLGAGLQLADGPAAYLRARYTGSLRDILCTYQRAFKTALVPHRFRLSAEPLPGDPQSELGYLLDHPQTFAGRAYYRTGPTTFATHQAWFVPDLLPVSDPYRTPSAAQDQRSNPSPRRQAALFDIWERLYDYTALRAETRTARERPAWRLFYEAAERQPDDPAELVRHLGIDVAHASQVLTYSALPADYPVATPDLESEAWAIRAWRAEAWLNRRERCFHPVWVGDSRPHRWVADDPGQTPDAGNENLSRFVLAGCLENGVPRRYEDVQALDDGLRRRGRDALVTWLCGMNRVALPFAPGRFAARADDLGDLLLQDVSCGTVERASRVEDAISSVQAFVQRARLGLEPGFAVTAALVELWDRRFATFRDWQCCAERELYRENWVEWDELRRARRVEAFGFLEDRLRDAALSVAVPGGMAWWPGRRPPAHPGLTESQAAQWSELAMLMPGPVPEGLDLFGTPWPDARPSWLAPISRGLDLQQNPGGPDDPGDGVIERTGEEGTAAAAARGPVEVPAADLERLPLWIPAPVRLGQRYVRVAAAGVPPASAGFVPCPDPNDDNCCTTCGGRHEALVDEYYFWLQDGREFDPVSQDAGTGKTAEDETSDWHRPEKLPALLFDATNPVVYLYWSRVRHGEFDPPRRSADPVAVDPALLMPGAGPQISFTGRLGDSLRFAVTGGAVPIGHTDPAAPGFRYDLATDSAVAVPFVVTPDSVAPGSFPGGLDAYPYFAYVCPGAPVEPLSLFSVALTVAGTLQAHCHFEAALKWYEVQRAPLAANNAWTECDRLPAPQDLAGPVGVTVPAAAIANRRAADVPCCPTIAADDVRARERAVLLHYLETMLDWADALISGNSPEAFRRADVIIDTAARILGTHPPTVYASAGDAPASTLDGFAARPARLNPRLMSLYERVDDRLALVHEHINSQRRRSGRPVTDMPYFGDDHRRDEWLRGSCGCGCGGDGDCARGCNPYRFTILADKAAMLAGEVRALGSSLLAAYEKGDAEYLAALRTTQECQLLELSLDVKLNQLRDADWQVQALNKTKEGAQARLRYYQNLITDGPTAEELGYETLTGVSTGFRTAGNLSETSAVSSAATPDFWLGEAGLMGSPLWFYQLPVGTKAAGGFASGARFLNVLADIASSGAGLSLTLAGWERREAEWRQQVEVISIEIEQIERQILGAERRRDQARRDLDNTQRQVENSAAVQTFLRDKFTSPELYLYLQRETAALYYQCYALARQAALQAERAFNYELGHTARSFVPADAWDSLREGLMAGERLTLAVRQMEKAYLDTNCREYELTKHISLRINFPLQFLRLRAAGIAEFEIPEWMFDVDYPGHYLRQIRNVSVSAPCTVHPYTGVHCRLTLLSSRTRVEPRLIEEPVRCCAAGCVADSCGCCPPGRSSYAALPDDPRLVRSYAATEAIATSTGQNDSGLFELSFHDERYLPFQFAGAVSRWRIELPPETNFFDLASLSDAVLHLNYTAREGGDALAAAAAKAARCRLPGDGLCLFDVRRDLSGVWPGLQRQHGHEGAVERGFDLNLSGSMFPFVPQRRVRSVSGLRLLVEGPCAEPGTTVVVRFFPNSHDHDGYDRSGCACERIDVACVAGRGHPGLFCGEVDLSEHGHLGPLPADRPIKLGRFEFPASLGEIRDMYLVVGYCAEPDCGCGPDAGCLCDGDAGGCGELAGCPRCAGHRGHGEREPNDRARDEHLRGESGRSDPGWGGDGRELGLGGGTSHARA
jgi:hypothetical protein